MARVIEMIKLAKVKYCTYNLEDGDINTERDGTWEYDALFTEEDLSQFIYECEVDGDGVEILEIDMVYIAKGVYDFYIATDMVDFEDLKPFFLSQYDFDHMGH